MAAGYRRRLKEERHREEMRWTHTRWLGALLININRDPKSAAVKPEDLIKLSFDREEEKPPVRTIDKDHARRLAERYAKK